MEATTTDDALAVPPCDDEAVSASCDEVAVASCCDEVAVASSCDDEVAVASFLSGALDYLGIAAVNAEVMAQMPCEAATSLAIIHEADARARDRASALIKKRII